MENQLLLIEDVIGVGKKGDLVTVKPGFSRNFLLPQKKAVIADKRTLRMRERLQQERAKQAEIDRKESEKIAAQIHDQVLTKEMKVDALGHMYGSVTALDVVELLKEKGVEITKRMVLLTKPIKTIGQHNIPLRLKEDVPAQIILDVQAEGAEEEVLMQPKEEIEPKEEIIEEEPEQE